jgi:F-type H+-transporting ATPase subunit delta
VSGRSSAVRYARALFDVAVAEADPVRIGRELEEFSSLVASHPLLQETFDNPGVDLPAKRRLVEALTARVSLSAPLAKLLALVAERNRFGSLSELNTAYQARLRAHQRVLEAEVTTAAPMEPTRVDALRARMEAATGQRVVLTTRVDETLIGGLVARVGGTIYDGSVAGQLSRMRTKLLER